MLVFAGVAKGIDMRFVSRIAVAISQQLGLVLAMLLLVAVFSILSPTFFTEGNFRNVLLQGSITAILAIGEMFVVVTAGIDLSIGSTLAVGAMISGLLLSAGSPLVVAIPCAILSGMVGGLVNGILVTVVKITPFIATLGTMSLFGGLAFIFTNGKILYSLPHEFLSILGGDVVTVPVAVVAMVIVGVVAWAVFRATKFGEYTKAIGGNEEVARLSGVAVRSYTTWAYVGAGGLAALSGTLLSARLGSADPTVGTDLMLPAIAACVMGGASLFGGRGSVGGAVLGAMLIAVLQSGLTLVNVQAFYQEVALGIVILGALTLDQLRGRGGKMGLLFGRLVVRKTPTDSTVKLPASAGVGERSS